MPTAALLSCSVLPTYPGLNANPTSPCLPPHAHTLISDSASMLLTLACNCSFDLLTRVMHRWHRDHQIKPAGSGQICLPSPPLFSGLLTFCLTLSPPWPILYFFLLAEKQALDSWRSMTKTHLLFSPESPASIGHKNPWSHFWKWGCTYHPRDGS